MDYLTQGGVDLVFGFPQRTAIAALDARAIGDSVAATLARMPAGKGQLTFIENHDMSRFASVVGGDARKERIGAALTVLLKGTPLIYYGQELGMKGKQSQAWGSDANDIPDREAFPWHRTADSPGTATWYRDTGPWWSDRYSRDGDGISVEDEEKDSTSLLAFYRRLLALRRARPELRSGGERVLPTDAADVLAIVRESGTDASVLLVNLGDAPRSVAVARAELPAALGAGPLEDLLAGAQQPAAGDSVRTQLAPFGIKLLARPSAPNGIRAQRNTGSGTLRAARMPAVTSRAANESVGSAAQAGRTTAGQKLPAPRNRPAHP